MCSDDESLLPTLSFRKLEEEVRALTRGTSSKFVPQPYFDEIYSDAIIGIKRFTNSVRNQARAIEWALKEEPDLDPEMILGRIDTKNDNRGLGTNLRPTNGSGSISTSISLEGV
jgi:hypothetical protein